MAPLINIDRSIKQFGNKREFNFLSQDLAKIQTAIQQLQGDKSTASAAVQAPATKQIVGGASPSTSASVVTVNGISGAVVIVGNAVSTQPGTQNILINAPLGGVNVQTGIFTLSAVTGGTGIYSGVIQGGASNAYVGQTFVVAGFTNTANNGSFSCTASTSGTLTLNNALSIAETHSATAEGDVYAAAASDYGRLIVQKSSTAQVLLLPSTAPSSNWFCATQCVGSGGSTVNPNGLNLDGSASNLSLTQNQGVFVFSDGTNYFTMRGIS